MIGCWFGLRLVMYISAFNSIICHCRTTKSLDAEIYTTRPSRCTWYKRRKVALQDLEREETRVRAAQVYEAVIQVRPSHWLFATTTLPTGSPHARNARFAARGFALPSRKDPRRPWLCWDCEQSIQHARYLTVPNGRTGKGVLGNGTIEDREVKTRLLSRREVVRCAGKCLPRTSHTFCFRAISRWLNREKKCIDFTVYRWCHFPFEPGSESDKWKGKEAGERCRQNACFWCIIHEQRANLSCIIDQANKS